jgi:hypothetical protein
MIGFPDFPLVTERIENATELPAVLDCHGERLGRSRGHRLLNERMRIVDNEESSAAYQCPRRSTSCPRSRAPVCSRIHAATLDADASTSSPDVSKTGTDQRGSPGNHDLHRSQTISGQWSRITSGIHCGLA